MKTSIKIILIALMLVASNVNAQDTYVGGSDVELTISGTSNVHDWDQTVNKMSGSGKIIPNTDGSFTIQSLDVIIQVQSIKSSKGSIMDSKTYDALKSEANPTITFKLASPINNIIIGSTIIAKGDLKIAGIPRPIELSVKVSGNSSKLFFEGSKSINMKDFGVTPPTAFMGAMKVGETVVIKFKSGYTKKINFN